MASRSRSYAITSPADAVSASSLSFRSYRTILQTNQAVVETRIRKDSRHLPWRSIVCYLPLGVQTEDADIVLAVNHNYLVCAELYLFYARSSWWVECCTDSSLAEDVDHAGAELGLVGTDGEEGLDRIVCEGGYLGIDAIASELRLVRSLSTNREDRTLTSSTWMVSGVMPNERSLWIPDCLPRRKDAMATTAIPTTRHRIEKNGESGCSGMGRQRGEVG